jgi:hypothetical protein
VSRARRAALWLALAVAAGAARGAAAHPLAPSLLEIRLEPEGTAEVRFKTPSLRPAGTAIEPVLPAHCQPLGDPLVRAEGTGTVFETRVDCGALGLVGQTVGFTGLAESSTNALLRIELPGGRAVRAALHGGRPTLVVPGEPGWRETARDYLALGFGHILGGADHLLFVAGLMLLVRGARMLVETITAFTVGHSVTLSLAALGLARAPAELLDVAIAASILWLAVEISLGGGEGARRSAWRRPRSMALGFGLLHGFGFAGALAQVGLPAGDIPLALASFNLGIEAGQLCFVAGLILLASALRSLHAPRPRWGSAAAAYTIGALASYWMFQRMAAWLV